jgi:hypothetical protein
MPKIYDKDKIHEQLEQFIEDNEDPTIPGFCCKKDMPCKDTLYEWCKEDSRFSDSIKRLVGKQEAFLIRAKDINPIMAIFRLKQPQHGYTDKQQIDTNVTQRVINVNITDDAE